MHTPICDELNIEFPIFAFTHCRDVVVAVSKAGGFGVLGAVGFTPEQLEIELAWIDENIGDHPYGVDIVIPNKYEGMDATDLSPEVLKKTLNDLVPQEHIDFAKKILADRDAAGRGRASASEVHVDRQRARNATCGNDQAHPRHGAQGRCAVRVAVSSAQARRRRRGHHHRPGR
jgi:NAD(P)H-dependent flavin oxidoreductase YrpB (nitropropane dioxygenase family)